MLSVVIPAYNEAARLPATLAAAREYLDAGGEEYEVIVVDDGSADGTVSVVEKEQASWTRLRLIKLERNQGKGAAVRAGMLQATGELRLFCDADSSTPLEEVTSLRRALDDKTQVAIGSRALDRAKIEVHQPRLRELMGKAYNVLLQLLVLPGIKDSQCGFKLFTAKAAQYCFEPLQTPRFGFDAEVLLRARMAGWRIAEVPVRWSHMEDSRVSALRDSIRVFIDLLRLRWRPSGL